MNSSSLDDYIQLLMQLQTGANIPEDMISLLSNCVMLKYHSDEQNRFSEPMPWIGIYIALAAMLCILLMVADLLHGLQNRKLWFPCEYFTINAASLSVIAVAMKLPMDLSNPTGGYADVAAKLGSMAFMCTMMANLLPSLSTMDSNELLNNFIALGVLVITLVVNVCIQIKTRVIYNASIAVTYVVMLLMLLIMHACSSLAILNFKWILESKYQAGHETTLKDQELQQPGIISNVEKLKRYVSNHPIMAGTGSPQFMIACSATCSASGVICAISTAIHVYIMFCECPSIMDHRSDYKWSISVILIIQFAGVVLGSIAPISRCFASLSFTLSIKWIWNHIKVFEVESYWTQNLSEWKQSSIPFSFGSRNCKIVVHNLKIIILEFCIGFQKTVVVACKMIGLIPTFFVIWVLYIFHCWKWLKDMVTTSGVAWVKKPEQHATKKHLSHYVLQVQDDMELAERTLNWITNSVDRLIKKAEMQRPRELMKLLKGSRGFENFDSHHVPPLTLEEPHNCWSLPVVTLTIIAVSLVDIQNNIIDSLLSSVSEGLVYVTLVEETLNCKDDHVSIQKAAQMLWTEVEIHHKWLGNRLRKLDPQVNTTREIPQWFRDIAKNMAIEGESANNRGLKETSMGRSISANAMYHITQTILLSYHDNIDKVSPEQLFAQLSSMIANIFVACLTHLPQVIALKCHASAIEKREASVQAAAQLLGETAQIINNLQDSKLPSLNADGMLFIEKLCACSRNPLP